MTAIVQASMASGRRRVAPMRSPAMKAENPTRYPECRILARVSHLACSEFRLKVAGLRPTRIETRAERDNQDYVRKTGFESSPKNDVILPTNGGHGYELACAASKISGAS